MIAPPGPPPVTGILALVVFALNVTVGGTDATAGFSELRLITRSVGAGADRNRNNCWVPVPLIVKVDGENITESLDEITWLTVK